MGHIFSVIYMASNFGLYLGHYDSYDVDFGFSYNPLENIVSFILAGN